MSNTKGNTIAIVGLSCRLPGGISNLGALWRACTEQRDLWQTIPNERLNNNASYHPDPGRYATSNVHGGYFLAENPGLFDAKFFGLTEMEARAMDPQQRILLELSYEALENAGLSMGSVIGSNTAVFIGSSCRDYADLLLGDREKTELYQATGVAQTMLSNRISYFYDFKGPSVSVDTACSSSLVALHLACNALKSGDARLAVVGGSNLILSHEPMIDLSMLRFLSPEGRCYSFDERADGFGRGEGAACIILKPLEDALRDGDRVRAVVRGSGTNQDGKTSGIAIPSGDAQVDLMRRTYQAAGLDPDQTGYVEAHGTGTPTGDPIEAASLSKFFTKGRTPEQPLTVGSIKSNIGHLEGASGVAAVVKAVLMLENGLILPNFDFQKPSVKIPIGMWNLQIPTSVQPWPSERERRVSINNFGFGGSNAHVILDAAPGHIALPARQRRKKSMTNGYAIDEKSHASRVFLLSSFDELTGRQQARNLALFLRDHRDGDSQDLFHDLAYTLSERRSNLHWKTALVASSPSQLAEALGDEKVPFSKVPHGQKNIGYIFTGQGAQWYAMGRELITMYPIFRKSLDLANQYLAGLGAPWSIIDELMKDAMASRVGEAVLSQPLLTAIQIAVVDLFASFNIIPTRVTGHSSGEIAAAYCAGALTQESAMAVAFHRGIVALKLSEKRNGAMLAVGLPDEDVRAIIQSLRHGCVKVACVNSASSVTVSGDRDAIVELSKVLTTNGHFSRELAVQVAYHSHHMQDVADDYLAALQKVTVTGDSRIEFYSSVRGKRMANSSLDREYWVSNMVEPVNFLASMRSLLSHGDVSTDVDVVLEIGPHSALQSPIKQILLQDPEPGAASVQYKPSLVRNVSAIRTCHELVAFLAEKGFPINLKAVNHPLNLTGTKVLIDLPSYPWNHSKAYWAEKTKINGDRDVFSRSDLLGVRVKDSIPAEPHWRNIIRPMEIPWVNDHKVQSSILYPAAGFFAMAIEAENQYALEKGKSIKEFHLREVSISHSLIIPQDGNNVETLVSLRPYNESIRVPSGAWHEFSIYSSTDRSAWIEHCRGLVSVRELSPISEVDGGRQGAEESRQLKQMTSEIEQCCTVRIDEKEMYKALDKLGLAFGPTFSNLRSVRLAAGRCSAEMVIPNTAAIMPAEFEYPFVIHPATLDSCIHAVLPIDSRLDRPEQGTPVPTYIEELIVSQNITRDPGHVFSIYAETKLRVAASSEKVGPEEKTWSVVVLDKGNIVKEPKILMKGIVLKNLPNTTQDTAPERESRTCYYMDWQPDLNLLLPAQIVEITKAFRTPFLQHDQARLSQQAAFYYAEQAIATISTKDLASMQLHRQRLHASLTRYCNEVREGQLGKFSTLNWTDLDNEQRAAVCRNVGRTPYGSLLQHVGENLPSILKQQTDPLAVIIENDRLESFYRTWEPIRQCYQQAAVFVKLLGYRNPHLNILEIGAGTGGVTLPILEALSEGNEAVPHFSNYDFTDISAASFEKAAEQLKPWSALITFQQLDIELDPVRQGFKLGSYDLIVAANVVHATRDINRSMRSVRKLLKPGGTLVLIEITVNTLGTSLIFGSLPNWWNAEDSSRADGSLLTEQQWNDVLTTAGFSGAKAILWDMPDPADHQSSTIISTAPVKARDSAPAVTIVTNEEGSTPCSNALELLLADADIDCCTVSLSQCDPIGRVCIVLSELTGSVLRNPASDVYESARNVFLQSDGVLWVTEGALIESSNPDLSLATGLARNVRIEKGDTTIVTLDLDGLNPLSASDRATKILAVFLASSLRETDGPSDLELEYAERGGTILIPRIVEDRQLSSTEPSTTQTAAVELQPYNQAHRRFKATIRTPGLLDSIQYVDDCTDGDLGDDEVEVQVKASGLNFRDVMTALGQISAYPLGCECCGVVSAIGNAVTNIMPGDRVIATAKDGCFRNIVRVPVQGVERVPHNMPYEVAASLPIVYFTAYLAVHKIARLSKGETVLIHAGSGGLGQAIINFCQSVGAIIFATVGTLEKKRLLVERYGIPEDHIFSSRDYTFAKGVMKMTKGRGVDVIMNSLSGEALRLTWNCIAPFGRFIELGKRDFAINTRLEMRNFEKNASFTGLDLPLDSMGAEKGHIWGEIMSWYSQGLIKAPWPITVFRASELEKALRIMQSGKHMGKLVLMPRPDDMVKVAPSRGDARLLRDDASYLLVGGLGGIGRATAVWMLTQGARNFIFTSRSGADRQKAQATIAFLQDRRARVFVSRCDISHAEELDQLLSDCGKSMPPIRGMIHAALVSKAELFARMKLQDYNDVMRPKVDGIWNLHDKLSKADLDFFIMLSSLVGIAGDPSQAAYVAASCFQDAFAAFRNHQGLPAVTLDLGRVVDIGIIAENSLARRSVRDLWSRDLREQEIMDRIRSAIASPLRPCDPCSIMIGLKDWTETAGSVFHAPMFSHFRRTGLRSFEKKQMEATTGTPSIRRTLVRATSLKEAAHYIRAELIFKTSDLLMLPVEDIDPSKSMAEIGMDSLVAAEMRNWLSRELDTTLPILELMSSSSMEELSMKITATSKLVSACGLEDKTRSN